jgi:hypothetical protein
MARPTADRATTINGAFRILSSRLEITGLHHQLVVTHQRNVRHAIENDLSITDSFLTGSYMRSTLIAPLKEADIDVVVVLDSSYFDSDARTTLDTVRRVLLKTYRTPVISRNGHAVTVRFSDFHVDVVPTFRREGGGYFIPSSSDNSWIATDPKKHVRLSSSRDTVHGGHLVPLIKMIKGWNRNANRQFRSFHLEVLAWEVFSQVTISSFSSGVRYFFDKAQPYMVQELPDPAGYGGDVAAYIGSREQVRTAILRLDTALWRALKAEEFAAANRIGSAFGQWRKIFGDYFPAYG